MSLFVTLCHFPIKKKSLYLIYPFLLAGQEIPPSGQTACFPNLLYTAKIEEALSAIDHVSDN